MNEMLTVYKASAGSGKTFTLAVEYIKLLIRNPHAYKSVLAVTFTNKATEEMKMRIISQLYGLWKGLPESNAYMAKICAEEQVSEAVVKKNAGIALMSLLHDYNYFRIETIDSFFQSVLRNLAHELDLTANLRVDLNDSQVKDEAVDSLFLKLDEDQNSLNWILGYINDKITDDNNWNIIRDIKKFGKKMFDDEYKAFSTKKSNVYGDDSKFEVIYKSLRTLSAQLKNEMVSLCDGICTELHNAGILQESVNKTIRAYIENIRNGNLMKPTTSKDITIAKWPQKKSVDHYSELCERADGLSAKIGEIESARNKYVSVTLTLGHINEMRLLRHVEDEVNDLNREANRFLLSNTPQLLNSLIKDTDAPFIFEKIGSRLDHIMIDEFQDTSITQWNNFKKLLLECMSHAGKKSLIVGDVKQSIYRWRSGDWRLLNDIENEQELKNQIDIVPLKTNYRSSKRIIDFNNAFFQKAIDVETCSLRSDGVSECDCDKLKKAYADVAQEEPAGKKDSGFVSMEIYQDKADLVTHQLDSIIAAVRQMRDHHIPESDIAILVRSNRNIQIIADRFAVDMPDVKIISNDAFRLDSSESVNVIINAMYLLNNPDDKLAKAYVVKIYQGILNGNILSDNKLLRSDQNLDEFMPKEFIDNRSQLLSMSLYTLAEKLYELFELNRLRSQDAYICAFYDYLIDFVNSNSSDIDLFIEEWKSNLCNKCIQSNDSNGIHVYTIHKSKGLEFDNVIIPFCDWKMEITGDTIWCKTPTDAAFEELGLVPIDYSSTLKNTCYKDAYLEEHFQNSVDNMNLLYVAFTRPRNNLFIIGSRYDRGKLVDVCLKDVQTELAGSIYTQGEKSNPTVFMFGEIADKKEKNNAGKKKDDAGNGENENVFLQPSCTKVIDIHSYKPHITFRQSNKSRAYIEEDNHDEQQQHYISNGIVLHKLLSDITSAEDLPNALKRMEQEGIMGSNIKVDSIRKMLHKCFETPQVRDWFSGKWKIFNECSIISSDIKRPDRVMVDAENNAVVVDFKFGNAKPEYQKQVKQYMELLAEMGYHSVKGYLWYVYQNKINEVK